jgi:predicted ATPase
LRAHSDVLVGQIELKSTLQVSVVHGARRKVWISVLRLGGLVLETLS